MGDERQPWSPPWHDGRGGDEIDQGSRLPSTQSRGTGIEWRSVALLVIGAATSIALALWAGIGDVAHALQAAGWVLLPLTMAHVVSLWLDAAAWWILTPPPRPTLLVFLGARWIREAVNALLPVAQIGGEAVAVRLLTRRGNGMGWHGAIVALDLAAEFNAMVVLGAIAAAVLLREVEPARSGDAIAVVIAMVPPSVTALVFLFAQRFRLLGRLARRLGSRWPRLAAGLRDAQAASETVWEVPVRMPTSVALHGLGWLFGAAETWVTLAALGHEVEPGRAFALEGTTEVLRSFGFMVPGVLGLQEGSLIVVGGLVGIAPAEAIALSLFRRARDAAIGLPAFGAWRLWAWRRGGRHGPAVGRGAPNGRPWDH